MSWKNLIWSSLLFLILSACSQENDHPPITDAQPQDSTETVIDTAQVEIVFCLDATGSMSGLIGTAKEKIWSIVTSIVQDTIPTEVKLGMVFYRDRGDAFVTKYIDLTPDIDSVYEELLAITATGGGDAPESVNQALFEAVTKNSWSQDAITYKTVFLVGDCPPHMDYEDEVQYMETCELAKEKGIIINTIKLGNGCPDAIPHFKNIASCSEGTYLHLDQMPMTWLSRPLSMNE